MQNQIVYLFINSSTKFDLANKILAIVLGTTLGTIGLLSCIILFLILIRKKRMFKKNSNAKISVKKNSKKVHVFPVTDSRSIIENKPQGSVGDNSFVPL